MVPTPAQCERRVRTLLRLVDRRVGRLRYPLAAEELARACEYVLDGGGKRVRALVLLLSCESVGGTVRKALPAAAALEALHNFTLVHDDIMDHAATRRGRPTIHTRWDESTAILTGDVLIGLAYASLGNSQDDGRVLGLFTRSMLEVCDGQALDLAFERRKTVVVSDYFRMIGKKTARLFAVSAELGGLIGGGKAGQIARLRTFGFHLGRAFQLQDDLLDVYAQKKKFGKSIGGDILEGKRTFLLLTALERARGKDRALLRNVMDRSARSGRRPGRSAARLIAEVTAVYERTGVAGAARAAIRLNTRRALDALQGLPPSPATGMLGWLAGRLLDRDS